jgi:hypothetical protein
VLRSLAASLTGLVAAVLLPLSLVSVWLHGVVTDTDKYVETVTPLADDDAVKAAAVKELQREAMQLVASTGTTLPPGGSRLVLLVVRNVVDGPAFRTAWVQANRIAHDQVVAVLERRGDARLDDQGRVTIDLTPVFATIASTLSAQGLGTADPSQFSTSLEVMDADQLAKARRAYDAMDALGFWLPVLWLVALVLTLLLARRRLAATAKLAVASLVALGLLALALAFARDAVTDDLPQRDVAQAVWDVVAASLWHRLEAGAVGLALVALVAAVLSTLSSRRARGQHPSGPHPDGAAAYG